MSLKLDTLSQDENKESGRLRKLFQTESTIIKKRFYVWVYKQKEREQEILLKEQN